MGMNDNIESTLNISAFLEKQQDIIQKHINNNNFSALQNSNKQ
jgi:hypothetical protein